MVTYYVSPKGKDSQTGSSGKPFATLSHAHNLAKPGDTILIREGVYPLKEGMFLTKDGLKGRPITISNYPGEKVIFDGSTMTGGYFGGYMLDLRSVSWNHIKGLEFRNGPDGGVLIRDASHHNIIENLNVHHIGPGNLNESKGIMLYGEGSHNLLLNNDSHDNRDASLGGADGFQISTSGVGNVLRGNRAWGNSDDGIDLFNVEDGSKVAPVLLDGNWAFDNGFDAMHRKGGDGTGFKLGGTRPGTDGTSGGHMVVNNLAWNNRVYGFYENGATESLTLYNNTAFQNGRYNFLFSEEPDDTLVNNLAVGSGKSLAVGNLSHNSWTLPFAVEKDDFITLDDASARGPRNADGSLPEGGFLKASPASQLIDAGDDIGRPFLGQAPDIGAFESTLVASPGTNGSLKGSEGPASNFALLLPTIGGFALPLAGAFIVVTILSRRKKRPD